MGKKLKMRNEMKINVVHHLACYTALNTVIYSTSVIDVTTVSCLFVDYKTSPSLI